MRHSFQFWLNDYAAGPIRGKWDDAVADAVAARQATPIGPRVISTTPHAHIRRLRVRPIHVAYMNPNRLTSGSPPSYD